jgi:hypothetical protein
MEAVAIALPVPAQIEAADASTQESGAQRKKKLNLAAAKRGINKAALALGVMVTPILSFGYNADATDLKSALPSTDMIADAWPAISMILFFTLTWAILFKLKKFAK